MSPESWQQRNTEVSKPIPEKKEESSGDFERKLSPEQIEQIMAKVQDIDEKGIAFSLIRDDKFENVFNDGLLGSYEEPDQVMSTEIDRKEWAARTRKERQSSVYFNITGRLADDDRFPASHENEILLTKWVRLNHLSKDKIVILFDLSTFKEEAPIFYRRHQNGEFKTKTYRTIDWWNRRMPKGMTMEEVTNIEYGSPEYQEAIKKIGEENEYRIKYFGDTAQEGESSSYEEDGFAASHRVAPRLFQGIVAKFTPDETWERRDEEKGAGLNISYQFKNPIFKERLKPYLDIMLKGNNLIPIYDPFGDLFWPKQMSHDEVKAFVAERDVKKEGESE